VTLAFNPSMRRAQTLREQVALQQQRAALQRMAVAQQAPPPGINISPVAAVQRRQTNAAAAATPRPSNVSGLGVDWGSVLKGSGVGAGGGGGDWLDSLKDIGGQIAQVPLKFLETLDYGRRAVLSTAKEIGDLSEGNGFSGSDWLEQTKDPAFGFGTIVGDVTGNEWLDRAIGLAGDVVADPLTYIAPGAHEFTGLLGRSALADLGVKAGLTEGRISEIARLGESALTRGERAGLGLDRAGYRFMGKRIPGTERLVEGTAPLAAKARARLGDTVVGRAVQRFRTPEGMEPFLQRLARGEGDLSAITATNQVAAHQAAKGAANNFTGRFGQDVKRVAREFGGRTELTHELEAGAASAEGKRLRGITEQMFEEASRADMGGVTALKHRENFVPHYNEPVFEEFLGRARQEGQFRARTGAEPEGSSRLLERVFQPNSDYTINGVDIHLDTASIQEITQKMWDNFPELRGQKLIEDDPAVWMSRLLEDHASDVGQVAWERRLRTGGSLRNEADVLTQVIDKEATKEARDHFIGRARADIKARRSQLADLKEQVREAVQGATKATKAEAKAGVGRAEARRTAAEGYLGGVREAQGRFRGEAAEQAAKVTAEGRAARQKLVELQQAFEQADAEVSRLQKIWATSNEPTYAQAYQRAMDIRQDLLQQVRDGLEAQKLVGQIETPSRAFVGQVEGPPTVVSGGAGQRVEDIGQEFVGQTEERVGRYYRGLGYARGAGDITDEQAQRLAAAAEGRDVMPQQVAEQVMTDLKGRQTDAIERQAERSVGARAETGQAPKAGGVYGATERDAAKRTLSAEELIKPGLFDDEVLASSPQRVREAWARVQADLDEALRPYRKSEAQAERVRSKGRMVTEAQARADAEARNALSKQITNGQRIARKVADNQGTASKLYRDIQTKLNDLRTQLHEMNRTAPRTEAAGEVDKPLKLAIANDPAIAAKVEDAKDLAEFIARKHRAVLDGTPDSQALDRYVVDKVLTSRKGRISERAAPMREALSTVVDSEYRGRNVSRYTEVEVKDLAEKQWKAYKRRHQSARDQWERFEADQVNGGLRAVGNPPSPPTFDIPDYPTIFKAADDFEKGALHYDDGTPYFEHTMADGDHRIADNAQELHALYEEDYDAAMARFEREQQQHAADMSAWRKEREQSVKAMQGRARKAGRRVPQRPMSRHEFIEEAERRLRAEKRYVPSAPQAAAQAKVDRAMAGQFRETLSALIEDVTSARKAKNVVDSDARRAGMAPAVHRGWGEKSIAALADSVRQSLDPDALARYQATGELPEAVMDAIERVRNSRGTDAVNSFEQQLRSTGGKFMPLEDWQREAREAAQKATPEATDKRAVARRDLKDQLGLGTSSGDIGRDDLTLGMALTDLRGNARRQVDEAEREFMRNISTLTGVKWDQPRKAITRYKGGRATKWMIDGADVEIADIRRAISGASGIPLEEFNDIQAPTRMMKRWLLDETMKPPPGTLTEAGQFEWHAMMTERAEAIDKMTEKQLFAELKGKLGKGRDRLNLEHVKLNRELTAAEAQDAYLNGMADAAYRHIDQGQAASIQGLYDSMSPQAKASLFDSVRQRAKALDHEAMDVEQRLARIDTAGRGRNTTHDPIDMLIGKRTEGVLSQSAGADRLAQDVLARSRGKAAIGIAQGVAGENLTEHELAQQLRLQAAGYTEANDLAAAKAAQAARNEAELADVASRPELYGGEHPVLEQGLRQEAELAAMQPDTALTQGVEAATQPGVDTAQQIVDMLNPQARRLTRAEQLARRNPTAALGTVDLSDVGGAQLRDQARADLAAMAQQRARLAGAEAETIAAGEASNVGQAAAQRKAFEESSAGMLAAGEQRAGFDVERQAALQARLGELGGPQAVATGQQAREQLTGTTVGQMAAEEQTKLRAGLVEEQRQAADIARSSKADLDAHQQAMAQLQGENRTALESYHNSMSILAGHEDAARTHVYDAQALIDTAKANVERLAKGAPERAKKATIDDYSDWVTSTQKWLGADIPADAKKLLQTSIDDLVKNGPKIDKKILGGQQFIKDAQAGKVIEVTKDQIMSGWKAYKSKVTGESLAIDSELDRSIANLAKAFDEPGQVWRAVDAYTKFFKAYATATPGFHIRNAMAASFMNFSDGVSARNQIDGGKIWTAHFRDPSGQWWNDPSIPARYRGKTARDVVAAVYNSGAGGQFSAAEIGERAFGKGSTSRTKKLLMDNLWVRGSKRSGEYVEGAVRSGMALDSLSRPGYLGRSGTIEGATQRINRIHFNYSQASKMDAKIRRVIPFWTFISRNVPLQMQQMVYNPRAYAMYNSFVRNFRDPNSDDSQLPEWMRQNSAFRVTPTTALMPDIGATQLQSSINKLTDPLSFASMLGPQWKIPAQLATGKNFFYGSDYGDNQYSELQGPMSALTPILSGLGLTEDLPGGGTAIKSQWFDAIKDAIPMLGTAQRVGDTGAQGFLGIPAREVTQEDITKEMTKRRNATKRDRNAEAAKREALAKLARTG
jgi:hypothetical protein